jgi:glycosyltransferase involved in cell wall biosynthesis
MKGLLVLAPDVPSLRTGGGSLRMFHMTRFLAERFDVDLIAPERAAADETRRLLGPFCRELVLVPPAPASLARRALRLGPYEREPGLATAIARRLRDGAYAAVHVEKPAMLPYLPRALALPIVLDTFAYGLAGPLRELRHERGVARRARTLLQLARFAAFDRFCWPATYRILLVSERDAAECRRARPDREVLVVPNGVDCAAVRPGPFRSDGARLVFSGDMGFAPNVHAAVLLASSVLPAVLRQRPEADLYLVGRTPSRVVQGLAGSRVTVTGAVDEMVPYLHLATVYVAPHWTGAGTRTKLLEAMAAGCAIVTTTVGLEGIEATAGQNVVIADDVASMAAAVVRLLARPEERRALGTAARRLVETRYDWSRCLAPLDRLYGELGVASAGAA